MVRSGQSTLCDNLNHRRSNAPVSHCPSCGSVVNDKLDAVKCTDARHDSARRQQNHFCVDCGKQLVATH